MRTRDGAPGRPAADPQRPAARPRRSSSARCRTRRSSRCSSASESGVEAAEAFRAGAATSRPRSEEHELAVLEEFMPEPLSEDELEQIVDDAIAENGATSMRDFGRVMADVMPQVAGRADGSASASSSARSWPDVHRDTRGTPTSSPRDRIEELARVARTDRSAPHCPPTLTPCSRSSTSRTTLRPSSPAIGDGVLDALRDRLHCTILLRGNRLTIEGERARRRRGARRRRRARRAGRGRTRDRPDAPSTPCSARSTRPRTSATSSRTSSGDTAARRSPRRRSPRSATSTPSAP